MTRLQVFLGLIASSAAIAGALAAGSAAAPERSAAPRASASTEAAAACSAAERRRRAAALRRYRRKMAAERRAYFRRHRSAKARRAFVRRQNAKLKRLQRALAACSTRRKRSTDLSIAFTETAAGGAQRRLRYRVTATNHGPLAASAVNIFLWRSGSTYLDSVAGPGTCRREFNVSCHAGALAVGESKTFEIVLRPGAEGSVTVGADVRANDFEADSKPANNRTETVTEVRAPAPSCPPALWPGFGQVDLLTEGDLGEDAAGHPAQGTASVAMLFVDFSDAPGNEPTTTLYQDLVPEADRLFREASYGRFGLDVTPLHRWVRMPFPLSQTSAVFRDAVAAADAEVDFRRFSMVVVVLPSNTARQTQALVTSPGNGLIADGAELRHGAVLAGDVLGRRGNSYGARVLVHELAHALGLPDLYDLRTPDVHRHVGSWDPMGSLSPMHDFLAWHKWKLGWLDGPQVGCLAGPGVAEDTLTPVAAPGGAKAIVALTGPSTAIVAEARRPVGGDAGICEDGVVVYSVDAMVISGWGPVSVRPAEADGERWPECGKLYEAPFALGPDEVSRFEDGAAGVVVEVLSSTQDGYRVRVTKR